MAFNINQFINTALPEDGYRPNLFQIGIVGPTAPLNFNFKAKATTLPSSNIGVTPVYYHGRQIKLAGDRSFDNWTVTVLLDENDFMIGGVRGAFEQWSALINNHVSNVRTLVPPRVGGYFGRGWITPMKKMGPIPLTTYSMEGCWPTEVGPVQLDWADNDRVAEFQVTFAYQWWSSTMIPGTLT